jgi:hypothetical protein
MSHQESKPVCCNCSQLAHYLSTPGALSFCTYFCANNYAIRNTLKFSLVPLPEGKGAAC